MVKSSATLTDPFISLSKEFLDNPYPTFARLREEAPVFWSEKGKYWIVSRYQDANSILRDLHYEKGIQRWKAFNPLIKLVPQLSEQLKFRGKSMLNQDPPDHTRLRSLVNKAFTPTMVNQMRSHIESIADDLIGQVEKRREMDLVAEFAFILPVTVIAEMLGVPPKDRDQFKEWSHHLTAALEPSPDIPRLMKAAGASQHLMAYLRPLIEERRKDPQADLISALVQAEEEGNKLSPEELVSNLILLLVAGHETTVNLIGNGVLALLRNPDQLDLLKSKPELLPTAVDEFLRYESPVQFVRRAAGGDMELAGQHLREDDMLFVLLGSANRDPNQFEHPDTLDITRTNNKHLAFGSGIHHCLGSSLAQLEGQIAIGTLLKRLPNLQLKTNRLEYKVPFALRGVKTMPVTF